MTLTQTMSIIQPLVQVVLWPLLLLLVPPVYRRLLASMPAAKAAIIDKIVKHAVQSVEQKLALASGEEKRKAAEEAIYTMANFFGITLDPAVVSTILESFVWETKLSKPLELITSTPEKPKLA